MFKQKAGKVLFLIKRFFNSCISAFQKYQFAECGENVVIGGDCDFIPAHIHCGHHIHIGPHASFIAGISHIYIGNYVTFGPSVSIRGGDHRTDVIGKHIYQVTNKEKSPENDKNVYIEDGVWCGCNVTILKGVRIGRGAVIAAGAVVNKDIPPYCIAGGVPCKFIKFRWPIDKILLHESMLYSEKRRISKAELERYFANNIAPSNNHFSTLP